MQKLQIAATCFLAFFLIAITFTNFSLTGYWPDFFVAFFLVIFTMIVVLKKKTNNKGLTIILRTITIFFSSLCCLYLLLTIFFVPDVYVRKKFKDEIVNNRIFHSYFKPSAIGRGYGVFFITENPKYFPFIEKKVYIDYGTEYNFNRDTIDGKSTDDVIRLTIEKEIIDK